ncbi:MAG: disulfide bond formation protein B [Gammaproteobacteria bacterium]|nr:disulfide bond formation protein B [Gammaproteobacteria bacterium]NNF59850.1 disulfide bond formation protein B [Gammaproteobacteria bacterium]NNM21276.1 disulfide bond formation protein B [Gammaproteobacteria bacterium]
MLPLSARQVNLGGALTCAGLMACALYFQHVVGLDPCPLCVFQRIAVIALGIVFLVAFIHRSAGWGRYIYAVLFFLAGGFGAAVAARHVWIQNLPPDQVPACGPSLDYMLDTFPLADVLKKVFVGSGECAEVVWQFLGLSMPAWVLVWCVALGLAGVANSLRRPG